MMEQAPNEISGMHLFLVLWKTYKSMEVHEKQSISKQGFTSISDFGLLEVLRSKGPTPINTIGQKVYLTSGSMTAAVNRAEKSGYVERISDPSDQRVTLIALTAKGKQLIDKSLKLHASILERASSNLDQNERSQLTQLLKKLGTYASNLKPME